MSDLTDLPEVLNIDQVAAYLRVNRRTVVTALLDTGKLSGKKVGNQWRITRKALEEFLAKEVAG